MHTHQRTLARFAGILTCWALTASASALAQGISGGLFGATRSDTGADDKLNVQLAIAETWDSEPPPELRSFVPRSDLQAGRNATILAASADYARNRRRVQLFGGTSTYLRYVPTLARIAPGSQTANVGAGIGLPKNGALEITQAAAYSPSYFYQLFPAATGAAPGDAIPTNPDYRIDQTDSYSYRSRTTLAFGSPRRTRLTTKAEYSVTDFENRSTARLNLTTSAAGAKVSRAISRAGAVSAGYEYRTAQFGSLGLSKEHQVTLGVEYSPALSTSRRLIVRLDVSPSMFDVPAGIGRRTYPLQGEASVDYPFLFKWRASASYRRSVDYLALLSEPVLTDGARIMLKGVIGRRVDVSALGAYAAAVSAHVRDNRNLTTYTGEARIRYALTRTFAVYSSYSYYYYDLAGQARLAAGLPGVYEQRSIRAGFMLFARALD